MSSTRIETLVAEVQAAFDRQPDTIETDLATNEADVLQLRKSCRLLAGAETLLAEGFYVGRYRRRVADLQVATVHAAYLNIMC